MSTVCNQSWAYENIKGEEIKVNLWDDKDKTKDSLITIENEEYLDSCEIGTVGDAKLLIRKLKECIAFVEMREGK